MHAVKDYEWSMRGTDFTALTIAPDVAFMRTLLVNLYFVGTPGNPTGWALVDAGIRGSAQRIIAAAEALFGPGAKPDAIILTHGHFDHVGALPALLERWDAPVYAHRMELPYLTGRSSYPPPDPTVGGGSMALLSFLYPTGPYDFGSRVQALPEDGTVPGMPGWRWIETPGHSAGHVSFYREADRFLISGDAAITTKQESAMAVLTQREEIHGPPMYFTPDWPSARRSVQRLAALEPEILAPGHGLPLRGAEAHLALIDLAAAFEAVAMPTHGRYVGHPARADERGVVWIPPAPETDLPKILIGTAAAIVVGLAVMKLVGPRLRRREEAPVLTSGIPRATGERAVSAQRATDRPRPAVPIPVDHRLPAEASA